MGRRAGRLRPGCPADPVTSDRRAREAAFGTGEPGRRRPHRRGAEGTQAPQGCCSCPAVTSAPAFPPATARGWGERAGGGRHGVWGGTGSSPGLETGHGDRTGQRGVRGGDLQRLSLNGGLGPRFGTWGQARPWWGVVEGTPTVGPREPVPLGSAGKRGDTGWVKRCPFSDGVGSPSRRERDQA